MKYLQLLKNGRRLKKPWRLVLGITAIAVGILGLFLPIIPGVILIILGFYVLTGIWKKDKKNIIKK